MGEARLWRERYRVLFDRTLPGTRPTNWLITPRCRHKPPVISLTLKKHSDELEELDLDRSAVASPGEGRFLCHMVRRGVCNSSRRKIIFVHGCFWHQHDGCVFSHVPRSNVSHWAPKLEGNRLR